MGEINNSIYTLILLVNGVLAMNWAIYGMLDRDRNRVKKAFIGGMGFSSSLWSVGFAFVFYTRNVTFAYYMRCLGMVGVFGYLIVTVLLVSDIAQVAGKRKWIGEGFSMIGIPLAIAASLPGQAVFTLGEHGMEYSLKAGIINEIYTLYSVGVAGVIAFYSICIFKNTSGRRYHKLAKRFLITDGIVCLGMVLDTVFPLLGKAAIPGSSILQFYGFCAVIMAFRDVDRAATTEANISQFVYSYMSTPVCVFDVNKKLCLANDSALEFLHLERPQIEDKIYKLSDFFENTRGEMLDFSDNRKISRKKCIANDAQCVIRMDKIRDKYQDIIGYLVAIEDITHQVKMMNNLEQANHAKGVFLANMSHEIRTPMNSILGFSELLLLDEMPAKQKEYVDAIREASYNLLGIIDEVLDISKLDAGREELTISNYNLVETLQQIVTKLAPTAKRKGLSFQTMLDPGLPRLLSGDESKIRAIIGHVLQNAIQYTMSGYVALETKVKELQKKECIIEIQIRDTGIGIKKENLDAIFSPFSQTNGSLLEGSQGTGLGLSIAKGFVSLMQGNIQVESQPGKGTTVTVTIPQKVVDGTPSGVEKLHVVRHKESEITRADYGNLPILVVDDNEVNLKVITKCLECYGLAVDTALSGAEGIQKCSEKEYALVFMDQMMPEMDGIQAMTRIRALESMPCYRRGGSSKIVALTANAIKGTREDLMELGFDEYLAKPVEFVKLEEVLRQFLKPGMINRVEEAASQAKPAGVLPEIHMEKGIKLCGGSEEAYLEILTLLVETCEKKLTSMDGQWRDDLKNFTIDIHGVKGMCYNVGADDMGNCAKELELAAKAGNVTVIEEKYPDFDKACREFLNLIEEYLQARGVTVRRKTEAGADLKELFQKLRKAAEEYDFPAMEKLMEEIKGRQLPEELSQIFGQLQSLVENMDVEQLVGCIDSALDMGEL